MNKYILLLLLCISHLGFSQKEYSKWLLSSGDMVTFSDGGVSIEVFTSACRYSNCICNPDGELEFYRIDDNVFNKKGEIIHSFKYWAHSNSFIHSNAEPNIYFMVCLGLDPKKNVSLSEVLVLDSDRGSVVDIYNLGEFARDLSFLDYYSRGVALFIPSYSLNSFVLDSRSHTKTGTIPLGTRYNNDAGVRDAIVSPSRDLLCCNNISSLALFNYSDITGLPSEPKEFVIESLVNFEFSEKGEYIYFQLIENLQIGQNLISVRRMKVSDLNELPSLEKSELVYSRYKIHRGGINYGDLQMSSTGVLCFNDDERPVLVAISDTDNPDGVTVNEYELPSGHLLFRGFYPKVLRNFIPPSDPCSSMEAPILKVKK